MPTFRAILLLALLPAGVHLPAQVAHLIRGLDFFYLPDTLWMEAGDSVKFQTQGMHNMVQVDEAAWLMNVAVSNGGFQTPTGQDTTFVIDDPGTYHFVCGPHASQGMKGVLIVAPSGSTGIDERVRTRPWAFPQPASWILFIPLRKGPNTIWLHDGRGAILIQRSFQGPSTAQLAVDRLPPGTYILRVEDDSGVKHGTVSIVH